MERQHESDAVQIDAVQFDAVELDTVRFDTVLFDLDGTISDSAPGILSSLQGAFEEHDIDWVDAATARSVLGPPFHVSLPPLVGQHRLQSVIAAYRRRYADGKAMFDTSLYHRIHHVLEELHGRGLRLAVATSKPEVLAVQILQHLEVDRFFTTIGGDTLDGARGSKALVVGDVLRRLDAPDPSTVIMIGDRHHDVEGAREHGVSCVGALWGYGSLPELEDAGAWAICTEPIELLGVL